MKRILLLVALFLYMGVQVAFAQSRTLSGKVLDEKGEGIPGASVQVKGSTTGSVTDIDGNFQIEVPEGKNVLVVKGMGTAAKEVTVSDFSKALTVSMTAGDSQEIEEVQVYGQSVDPRKATGSVNTITSKEIEKRPITNVIKALDGTAGIQVQSGGGQPGANPTINVRGFGSLSASGSPLIVVDGSVYDGSLLSINPTDVASMSLLKDATASSLYGARGANGVILITTKKGRKGEKPTINVDGSVGFVNRMLPARQTVNQADYYKLSYNMLKNYFIQQGDLQEGKAMTPGMMNVFWDQVMGGYNAYNMPKSQVIDPATGQINPNASLLWNDNWMNELSRNGLRQQYNVSVSNGDNRGDYYFSVGYNKDQGIVKYTNYDRVTTRLNVNSQVTPWLKSGINLAGSFDNQRNFVTQTNAFSNPFLSAQSVGPIFPVYKYDTSGNRLYEPDGTPLYDFGDNPEYGQSRNYGKNTNVIASLQKDDRTNYTYGARGVGYLEAKFLKDFTVRTDISLDYSNYTGNFYGSSQYGDFSRLGGLLQKTQQTQLSYTFRQQLFWKPSFSIFAPDNGHSLTVTLDHENYYLKRQYSFIERTGFTGPTFKEGAAAAVAGSSNSTTDYLAMESYLAAASYDYQNKYFLSASIRRDGTSRFSSSARWGNFYSIGGGWTISREDFMKPLTDKWLSNLKVRVSYGIQGNENLGSNFYSYLPTYYFNPNNTSPGYSFNGWGNPNLKWEGQYMFNVGLDVGLFNDRISVSLDGYKRGSSDLLYVRPYAPSTGIGGINDNVGAMQNMGLEAVIKAAIVVPHNANAFGWDVAVNLQRIRNKMTKAQNAKNDSIIGAITLLAPGQPVNAFFMPEYAGVDPQNGDELYRLADGSVTNNYNEASLVKNKKIVGSAFRQLEGSLVNNFSYKGFDLSFQVNFGIGGKFYDNNYQTLMGPDNGFAGLAWSTDMLNAWTYDNKSGTIPRVGIGETNIAQPSTRFLMSASFLKLQNVNIGYNIPQKYLKTLGFTKLRVYVAADNLFLITGRKGVDIQESYFGTSSLSYYPYRSVMFGVNIGL